LASDPVAGSGELHPGALAQRLIHAPRLTAPDANRTRVADWQSSIADTAAGRSLARMCADVPLVGRLIEGIADGSPYLWDLVTADAARFLSLLASDPDERLAALLAWTQGQVSSSLDDGEAMRLLRRMKSEAALLIAAADIGGVWEVVQVIRALTEVADTACSGAVRFLLAGAARNGKLAPEDRARPELGSGYVVLAMGKMGGFELNYSSDIDLIIFYDPAAPALVAGVEPSALFVRLTRNLIKLLQERTVDGYVFRVDVRLRPDPSSTQIAISIPAALDYYESVGQNWERAAMIKARPCAGDLAAGEGVLSALSPFIWRKYLDFAAVGEVHAMKRQIHAYKGHGDIAVEGHNIKLGRGGIREIEFFVQTQQLIAGGRNPGLRGRETLTMLSTLVDGGWIDAAARTDLDAAYRFLRTVEHRLQMVGDEQTHTLPTDRAGLERFARFLGYAGRDAFADALVFQLIAVQRHYSRLFEDMPARSAEQRGLVFAADADDHDTLDKLSGMGFVRPLEVSATVRRWLAGVPRGVKSEAARQNLAELVPLLLDQFALYENPDVTLAAFDRFLDGLNRGTRLLSLLRQNLDLLALVALLLGTAPRLADTVAHHPQVMDALIDPTFFGALPDAAKLEAGLARSIDQAEFYEDFLDRVRMFGQEQMFLIGARILSGTVSAQQAGEAFAGLADVVIRSLHKRVGDSFAEQHGRIRGQQSAVVALGKLGGREMTATSDLDLIIIYDFDAEHPESDGARPLYGGQYYARLTQRLINALTIPTNYGRLYDVDMRLRPSGRSGPVATSLSAFDDYQHNEAWAWEHMALTRARVVSSSPEFARRVEGVVQKVLRTARDRQTVAGDVVEMRRAIAIEKGDSEPWNLKYAAGGLVDLEFIVQYLQLIHAAEHPEILDTSTVGVLAKAARLGLLSVEDSDVLRPAGRLFHDLTQILRLCLPGPFDPKKAGPDLLGLLVRAADVPDFATLEAHVVETQAKVRQSFVRILGETP
jgi:[glutamine synthetase] adenylyltransferase / [glutamine synthetase]-adenylyl-L-tyrosine phosphorylase